MHPVIPCKERKAPLRWRSHRNRLRLGVFTGERNSDASETETSFSEKHHKGIGRKEEVLSGEKKPSYAPEKEATLKGGK